MLGKQALQSIQLHVICFLVLLCSIGLFSSEDKGRLFVPNAEAKKCSIISSKTGRLIDIDVEAVKSAVEIFTVPLALASV